ncbi:SDR family NAD(P)-dependent oxidoreductase [Cryptosporangium japonicum]|uniref:Oxidoreductase n=1 Tax=Cryptosporangium japonicum TaxID=80872 RepID=A0ABN0U4S7_9ACTN
MALTWTFDDMPDQTGRTVVITGATSGLGLVLTDQLARRGADVIMAVRDVAKGNRVRASLTGRLEVREVDVADLDSVRRFAEDLRSDGRAIDVLVNNAGTGAQARTLTRQGYESTFATNHLGAFALTGSVLDLFRPDRDPRVVAVGSNLYRWGSPRTDFEDLTGERFAAGPVYVKSKVANLLFGAELDRRLRAAGSPVRSFLAHPGMAATPLNANPGKLGERLLVGLMGAVFRRSAEAGALPLAFAATDPRAETGVFLGPSARKSDLRVHFEPLKRPADDEALAARLWTLSEDATGVRYLDEVASGQRP